MSVLILGLDPALPLFNLAGPGSRISTEDADNVEIIHSNAGLLGVINPLGHFDFYPNGGVFQIGCKVPTSPCSHSRSWQIFAESINSEKGFYGNKCKNHVATILGNCRGDLAQMGGIKDEIEKSGAYYFKTNEFPPYALGKI